MCNVRAGNHADILGLGSRFSFLHIIIYYRPSVVAAFFSFLNRRADDAHDTTMYDGLDAGADTGISHRRKIP